VNLVPILFLTMLAVTTLDDEQSVREARDASNQAIADHDAAEVARFLAPDYHIVTSTSAQTAGREENRASWQEHFDDSPDVIYVRLPDRVRIFTAWAMASERGTWSGSWTEEAGRVEIGGDYTAKWRKVSGRWLIQAEIFTPTYCRGTDYCDQSP